MEKKGGSKYTSNLISKSKTFKKKGKRKNTFKIRLPNASKKKNPKNIEKEYRKVLNVFKKYFKSIIKNEKEGDERFAEFVIEIENKLNKNILNKIKDEYNDVYNVFDETTINSDDTIQLYVNLINNLDEKENEHSVNGNLRTNITIVQTMIADDLIERFITKTNNMVLENGNNGLNGLSSMIKRLNVKEDSSMDDLMDAWKKLGV